MKNRQVYITEEKIKQYAIYLKNEKKAAGTIEKYIRDIKSFTDFLNGGAVTKEAVIVDKGKTRTIFIPNDLRKSLLNYAKKNNILSGLLFITRKGSPLNRSNIWADMKKLCVIAEVEATKVFPHNLRSLFSRVFYSIDKDLAKLADMLGHSSIDTTRIYVMESGGKHRKIVENLGLARLRYT